LNRTIQPELLDELPADNPGAIRSRRDLLRLNTWMGNAQTIAKALKNTLEPDAPHRIVELGAGDGEFLLRVAQHYAAKSLTPRINALLVDQQNLVRPETRTKLEHLGWKTRAIEADVFDFLEHQAEAADAFISNLFLHHFSDVQLRRLFLLASRRARTFIAVEPRRTPLARWFSRMIWAIGCNAVTRHDAVVSVEAGFTGRELSALWPDAQDWELTEQSAGLFSHLFVARRRGV
jgi:Methyltransferase domain